MNVVKEINRINEREAALGLDDRGSWHDQYRDSAWIYIGGLPYELTEGDVLCVFSQYGEVEDAHLIRDEDTGKSKGFAFLKYEDFRSTVLAVDNFNGMKLLGRTLRVDHKLKYEPPQKKKEERTEEDMGPKQFEPGHAYKGKELASEFDMSKGFDPYARPAQPQPASGDAGRAGGSDADSPRPRSRKHKSKDKRKYRRRSRSRSRSRSRERRRSSQSAVARGGDGRRQRSTSRERRDQPAPALLPTTMLPPPDAAAVAGPQSWRGRYDPAAQAAATQAAEPAGWRGARDSQAAAAGGASAGQRISNPQPREGLTGIAGMHRRR